MRINHLHNCALLATLFAFVVSAATPCYVRAQEEAVTPPTGVQTLAPVIVVGTADAPVAPKLSLNQDVLSQIPVGNNSLNEQLRLFPGLQLSEDYNSAATGGEILPPALSISGGKIYQNNFLVDGIANNNLIDPAAETNDDLTADAPGHPQERFLNSNLIDRVTLYDTNVPARFGSFAGGVIEATTRSPGREFAGELSYRTTRSDWTEFHIAKADEEDFAAGGHENLQPRFTKNDYGATLSFPLTAKSGLLTSWRRLDSRIPLPYFLGTRVQQRQQQSYFMKYVGEISAADHLEFSLNMTPYREERFLNNVLRSDYQVKNDGLALQGEWTHALSRAELEFSTAYRHSRQLRSAPQHFFQWAATDSRAWGRQLGSEFSVEGGFGTVEKIQESFDLKSLLRLDPIVTGPLRHEVTGGLDFTHTFGRFERKETTYAYKGARLSPDILCDGTTLDCVEGEQFFTTRTVYSAGKGQAEINQLALHGEDLLYYRRLELRPGLRLDYNDLMKVTNLAPRFVARYDLFGSGATVASLGANRYYASTLLTDKLREAKIPFRTESRTSYQNHLTSWVPASAHGPYVTRFTTLKTPYADELSIGLDQKLAGGLCSLIYLRREGRDEFARTYSPLQADGLRYYTLNNLGRSHHERYSLAWERRWSRHFLAFNASWQETTTNSESYDTVLDEEDLDSRIWYNDELIFKSDLPARGQNRPLVITLIWVAELPAGLTFTNLSRYRSGYREIVSTGEFRPLSEGVQRIDPLTGEEILDAVAVYEEKRHSGRVIFDWKLDWITPVFHRQRLALSLEINNVFNARTQTGGTTKTFEMGRQFWAGLSYGF